MHVTPEIDSETVVQAVAGQSKAQERVLLHYYGFIRATLVQLTFGRIDDLQELQQQAMIRVARGLPKFASESQLSTWIRGVCANVVKDYLRARRRRANAEARHQTLNREHDYLEPAGALEARDLLQIVRAALDTLSPEQRNVFVLRVLYGYAVDEVATMTHASRAATRARLYFARRRVLAELKQQLGEQSEADFAKVIAEVSSDET